jgi:uncharacterized membrane protein
MRFPDARATAIACLLALLAACGGDNGTRTEARKDAEGSEEPPAEIPRRGVAVKTGDTFTFQECGVPAGRPLNLVDRWGEMAKAFTSLDAAASAGIYVELRGKLSSDGGSLTIDELVRARQPGNGLACEPPVFAGDYVANGNEPFWAIEIREDGIVFKTPGEPKGRIYPYAITRTETGSAVYATKLDTPKVSTLEIALEPARCVDSMSGEVRAFKAHVVHNKTTLEGCAAAGVPPGGYGDAPLNELTRFLGTRPDTAGMWSQAALAPRLAALLGAKEKTLLEHLHVRSPLMWDGRVFYVTGNKPQQGGIDMAAFVADPATDTINVILVTGGVREDFKEAGRDVTLPAEVAAAFVNQAKP